jgi:hypothetical protein
MEPPLNAPLNPVVATPYSPRGPDPRTSVHDPLSGSATVEADSLVQILLPGVRAILLNERTGEAPSMLNTTPVSTFPCTSVLGTVVFVNTSVNVLPEIVNSAEPVAVALASGFIPVPENRTEPSDEVHAKRAIKSPKMTRIPFPLLV